MAKQTAKQMANAHYLNTFGNKIYTYTTKDNPYYRKHPKHVAWHNDFYDECARIGRAPYTSISKHRRVDVF